MLVEMAGAAMSVIAADQASKAFILSRSWAVDADTGFLSIRKQLTRRVVPISTLPTLALASLWIASLAILAVLLQQGMIPENAMGAVGIGAALGGAAGNLADRLRHGAIVDFIVIGRWPVFNLADAAIVGGIGLLLLSFVET
jgi:signal peptidase II